MTNQQVAERFARGESGSSGTLLSTGSELVSYALPIARRHNGSPVRIIARGPSHTTRAHIGLARRACPGAVTVAAL